jgi:hypothetical protein
VVGLFHGMGFKGEVGKNSLCAGTRRSQPEVFPSAQLFDVDICRCFTFNLEKLLL